MILNNKKRLGRKAHPCQISNALSGVVSKITLHGSKNGLKRERESITMTRNPFDPLYGGSPMLISCLWKVRLVMKDGVIYN